MTDIRQNEKYVEYMKSQKWIVEERDGVYYFIKKIFFIALMKVQRPKKVDLNFISELVKKYRIYQVYIEPRTFKEADILIKKGWQVNFPFLPSKTVILDLAKPQTALYESFTKDTRYEIRKSEKVNIRDENDTNKFWKYWKSAVNIKRYVLKEAQINALKDAFGKDCKFMVAEDGISGAIFLVAGDVGYYWYGFVNKTGRKKLSQYSVLWEGIKWAKSRGAKHFDMEGIFDERFPIPAWRGFTKFKKGFGGEIKKFPAAYKKTIMPF